MYCKGLTCVFLIFTLNVVFSAGKSKSRYSKEANEVKFGENPFKMMKVNLIWKKASKRLEDKEELRNLYSDLELQDLYETELKKYKSEGKDQDGGLAAKVLESYERILKTYLPEHASVSKKEGNIDSPTDESLNLIDDKESNDEDHKNIKAIFTDPKLEAMWRDAQTEGFSMDEIEVLRQEFNHQQMKNNEQQLVYKEILDNRDDSENSINDDLMSDYLEMEYKTNDIDKDKLYKKYMEKQMYYDESRQDSEPVFTDERITSLWSAVKKTNWTERQRESFLEELRHFETRIDKHNYYMSELQLVKELSIDQEVKNEKEEFLSEQADMLGEKILLLHTDLKNYVESAVNHAEL